MSKDEQIEKLQADLLTLSNKYQKQSKELDSFRKVAGYVAQIEGKHKEFKYAGDRALALLVEAYPVKK